ncbi:MAPEG family protein [compost metagenome]
MENLPVFGAIVLVISALGVDVPAVSYLSIMVLAARVCQSLVHVCHVQTDGFVAVRFAFFGVQLVGFLVLIVIAAGYGAGMLG